jgi:hypothetical protein
VAENSGALALSQCATSDSEVCGRDHAEATARGSEAVVRAIRCEWGSTAPTRDAGGAYQLLLTQAVFEPELWQLRATVPLAARMML